jgi:Flp pilus assembly protein TadG
MGAAGGLLKSFSLDDYGYEFGGDRAMKLFQAGKINLKDQTGQSLIEITLITPLLLVALYVPVDFGISFFIGNLTQVAVREGARVGSGLQKSGSVPNLLFSTAEASTVKTEVFSRLPNYLTNKAVTVTFYSGTGCLEFLQVTAQGSYNFSLYRLMRLLGATAPNSLTISRTTQMRYKYQPYMNDDYCTVPSSYGPYSS